MATAAIAIFVFGLLLQRRREYIVLRAQGIAPRTIRGLITVEAAVAALTGTAAGIAVGAAMGYYFVAVLRPLSSSTPHTDSHPPPVRPPPCWCWWRPSPRHSPDRA
jgi:ABC-type antimicrobial peptide transport system permease subunit